MTMAVKLFRQFQTYWQASTDAHLHLECHTEKVLMNLQIQLDHPSPPPPLQRHPQQPRQSPSRHRRRYRRAEARSAAEAVNRATEDVAVQTEDDNVNNYYDVRPTDPPILPDVHVQQFQQLKKLPCL